MLESPCIERRQILLPSLGAVDRHSGLGDHAPCEDHGVPGVGDGAGIAIKKAVHAPREHLPSHVMGGVNYNLRIAVDWDKPWSWFK